jgi:SP family general alpha glucoside:H+ symporter-like MFS transporter
MSAEKTGAIEHHDYGVEPNGNFDRSWREEKWDGKALQQEAHETFVDEKDLGPLEALKAYPMAVVWALVMATCVIMEGYDTNLMGNFFAYRESNLSVPRFYTKSLQRLSRSSMVALWEFQSKLPPAINSLQHGTLVSLKPLELVASLEHF